MSSIVIYRKTRRKKKFEKFKRDDYFQDMMQIPRIPKRMFKEGEKKSVSLKLPESLVNELRSIASEYGYTLTEIATTALDSFCQEYRKEQKESKVIK